MWIFQNNCIIDWKQAIKCHYKSNSLFLSDYCKQTLIRQNAGFFFSCIVWFVPLCMENSIRKMSQIEKGIYRGGYLMFIQCRIKDFIPVQKAGHFLIYVVLQNFCQSLCSIIVKYSKKWSSLPLKSLSSCLTCAFTCSTLYKIQCLSRNGCFQKIWINFYRWVVHTHC